MPLLNFWKNSKEDVLKLKIDQIVSNAGDGSLRDNSDCSMELRQYLGQCPSESLFAYAQQCLDKSFSNSGLALQDIVNEFGRRLDFEVEDGLYRGRPNAIGFDGIWRSQNEPDLIVEVKTTDFVSLDLDTHAGYKERLLSESRTSKNAATLIVVGREDTGALEAQIRGSRYAWDMRMISIERLVKLVQIKEKSDEKTTLRQIRQLLQPFEYTKIDRIIDVIFTTAQNVETQQGLETEAASVETAASEELEREPGKQIRTNLEELNGKRLAAVSAFANVKGEALIRRSTTLFSNPDKTLRVCCAVSKRYASDYQPYWYAFHPAWNDFLNEGKDAYFILSCMDRDEAYAIPYSWLRDNLATLNQTDRGERSYWHIPVTILPGGELAINASKVSLKTQLTKWCFKF